MTEKAFYITWDEYCIACDLFTSQAMFRHQGDSEGWVDPGDFDRFFFFKITTTHPPPASYSLAHYGLGQTQFICFLDLS